MESPETLSDENVEEIVDIWNKRTEELMFIILIFSYM